LSLVAGLSVIFTHVLVVGSNEPDDGLLALVAHVDTDEHGLVGDLGTEVHAPEITTELGVDLTDDVQIDTVIISVDGLARHKLRDNGVVRVYFILDLLVEYFLSQGVRDDHEEELHNGGCGLGWLLLGLVYVVPEVGIDGILEVLD